MFSKKEFAIVSNVIWDLLAEQISCSVEHEKNFIISGPGVSDVWAVVKRLPIFR